jgi:hypothetical protein
MLHWRRLCFPSCSGRSCQRNGLIHFITTLSICLSRQIYIIIFAQKKPVENRTPPQSTMGYWNAVDEPGPSMPSIGFSTPALLWSTLQHLAQFNWSPSAQNPDNWRGPFLHLSQASVQEWRCNGDTSVTREPPFGKLKGKYNFEMPFFRQ